MKGVFENWGKIGGEKIEMGKKFSVIFLILVIINLTPAFASQLGDVAKDAEDYNIESQKEMGFFAQISFITKGFALVNRAEEAQETSNNVENSNNDEIDEYEAIWNQYSESELQKQHLIEFQKAKSANKTTASYQNKSNNSTSKNSTQTENTKVPIPKECFNDADHIIAMLNGLLLSKTVHKIDKNLMGQMVQLTDKGYIRYAYVKDIVLNGSNPHITLITNSGNIISMSLDEFQKQYTGLALKIKPGQNPESVLNMILKAQSNELKSIEEKNTKLKDQAKTGMFINGLLIGLAIILIVVGILLASTFGKRLLRIYRHNTFPDGTHFGGVKFEDGHTFTNIMKNQQAWWGTNLKYRQLLRLMDKIVYASIIKGMTAIVINELVTIGFEITTVSTAELIMNIVAQNFIKVVLCAVGIILFLCGIALGIHSIVQTVKNGLNWWYTAEIIKTNKEDYDALDKWSKTKQIVKKQLNNNQTVNIPMNKNTTTRNSGILPT